MTCFNFSSSTPVVVNKNNIARGFNGNAKSVLCNSFLTVSTSSLL